MNYRTEFSNKLEDKGVAQDTIIGYLKGIVKGIKAKGYTKDMIDGYLGGIINGLEYLDNEKQRIHYLEWTMKKLSKENS